MLEHSTLPQATFKQSCQGNNSTDGFGTLSATLKTAGIQTITATDTANNEITGDSNQISVNANNALPGYIVISPSSATIAAGFKLQLSYSMNLAIAR
jgi:hypothetical protein